MDMHAIDQSYQQLQNQSQQTIQALSSLSQKLRNATQGGSQDAREWQLDLREIALQIQQEQNQMTALLQAIHSFVANQVQQPAFQPQQPGYQPQPQYQQAPQDYQQQGALAGGGGALHHFLGGGFGQAIVRGAGFGIGDDLINQLFR